jgi:hypothetical protein
MLIALLITLRERRFSRIPRANRASACRRLNMLAPQLLAGLQAIAVGRPDSSGRRLSIVVTLNCQAFPSRGELD